MTELFHTAFELLIRGVDVPINTRTMIEWFETHYDEFLNTSPLDLPGRELDCLASATVNTEHVGVYNKICFLLKRTLGHQ